jgi:hypothetical protein
MHQFCTEERDYLDLPAKAYDWTYTVYGKVEELLPVDAPGPLGNHVTLPHYFDANMMQVIFYDGSCFSCFQLLYHTLG